MWQKDSLAAVFILAGEFICQFAVIRSQELEYDSPFRAIVKVRTISNESNKNNELKNTVNGNQKLQMLEF